MSDHRPKRLGIIQSRGLGDIVIALPIAGWYRDQGWEIVWPVQADFMPSLTAAAPWVDWRPLKANSGAFFYDDPQELLVAEAVDQILCLYQALTGHPEFQQRPEWQIVGFDQIKYSIASVPFLHKWRLADYITRDPQSEAELRARVCDGRPYAVLHLKGSDHTAEFDRSIIPPDWQIIEIADQTPRVFDWLSVLESAEVIVAVDSVIANIVDQLGLANTVDSYWIPRSHIQLTPVLGSSWTILDPGPSVSNRQKIFR